MPQTYAARIYGSGSEYSSGILKGDRTQAAMSGRKRANQHVILNQHFRSGAAGACVPYALP